MGAKRAACMRRSADVFVQVVNLLNFEYDGSEGIQLAEKVLSTLAVLLKGNEGSRRRVVSDVGYDQILMAVTRQVWRQQLTPVH